jgi:hypothetical protein
VKEDPVMRDIDRFVDAIPEPHPSLRTRVMAAVPPDDRHQPGLRWAGAIAVLLVALVVGTLVFGLRGFSGRVLPVV